MIGIEQTLFLSKKTETTWHLKPSHKYHHGQKWMIQSPVTHNLSHNNKISDRNLWKETPCRPFTVPHFSVRSPRLHANSKMGAIFVYIASTTCGEDDKPPMLIHLTHASSVHCHPLSRLHSQYKQRWCS